MSPPGSSLRAPLLWLLLPFMAGIALGDCFSANRIALLLLLGASALLALGAWLAADKTQGRSPFLWASLLLGAGMAQGIVALHLRCPRWEHTLAAPREVVVELTIDQLFVPAAGRKTLGGLGRITAAAPHLQELQGQRVYFSVLRRTGPPPERTGRYRLRGVLSRLEAEERFSTGFRSYLESAGVQLTLTRAQVEQTTQPPGWFRRFCNRTERKLEGILRLGITRHPGETSLYLAMLLGEKAALSAEQQSTFMRSGTFHVFSISGLHVGVIATAILSLLQLVRFSRRTATLAGLAILWLYVQVTGASVPAERAFRMIAFLSVSRVFRLPGNSLAALAAAALLTLWLDPRQLFSAGFQLSYTVVTAIVVMAVPLAERRRAAWQPWSALPKALWGRRHHALLWLSRELIDGWTATWAAFLASIPASIGFFALFSPGALLANLLVIPLSTLALIAGLASLVGGLTGTTGLCLIFNHAAVVLIRSMDWLLQRGMELPGVYFPAQFQLPVLAPWATVVVLGVMLAGASLRWPRRWGAPWWPVLVVVLLLFLGVKFN